MTTTPAETAPSTLPGASGTEKFTPRSKSERLLAAVVPAPEKGDGPPTAKSVLYPLIKPYRWQLALALFLNAVHGVAMTFQNVVPTYLIDHILTKTDNGVELTDATRWWRLAGLCGLFLLISIFGRMMMWHVGYRIFTWVRELVVRALRAQFFRHVNHLCLRFHGEHPSGELFSYLFGSPLSQIMQFIQHTSMMVPGSVVALITTVAVVAFWDLPLTGVLVFSVVTSVYMMRRSREQVELISTQYQKAEGDVSGRIADLLRGNKAVKMYAMEDIVMDRFNRAAATLGSKSYTRDVTMHMQWMKQETWGYCMFVLLLGTCTWRYLGHHVQLGQVTGYLLCFGGLQAPLQQVFTSITMWGSAKASITRIGTVLQASSSTPDPVGSELKVPASGDIIMDHVTFAYGDEPVLRDLTLTIPYGQTIAFVGPSGAGKSTISQLMLRLYDPQSGRITLGGVDLLHVRGNELRRRFGVVPQDPFIFRTSIRDNIAVARPDADEAAIRLACEQANAWEFISRQPKGLDTPVGEGGSTLSGGQRQRLAIARVLLASPPFFIFDEATSALDTISEDLIQQALNRNLGGRTAIFIAHRLATVKKVDRIVVLRNGMIEQDGTYDALVKQPGLFRELVEGQQLHG